MRALFYFSLAMACSEPICSERWKKCFYGRETTSKDVKYFDAVTSAKREIIIQRMIAVDSET